MSREEDLAVYEGRVTRGKIMATGVAEISMNALDYKEAEVMPHVALHASHDLLKDLPEPGTDESYELATRGVIRCTYVFILPEEA